METALQPSRIKASLDDSHGCVQNKMGAVFLLSSPETHIKARVCEYCHMVVLLD